MGIHRWTSARICGFAGDFHGDCFFFFVLHDHQIWEMMEHAGKIIVMSNFRGISCQQRLLWFYELFFRDFAKQNGDFKKQWDSMQILHTRIWCFTNTKKKLLTVGNWYLTQGQYLTNDVISKWLGVQPLAFDCKTRCWCLGTFLCWHTVDGCEILHQLR